MVIIKMWFFQSGISFTDILMRILSVLVIIFLILPLHECAHGFVAYKLGDPTAKNSGRLTLDPIPSIDPIGALGILLFGFGWAKPVPVNPNNFRNPKRDMAITALAGPMSNILAAIIGGLLFHAVLLFHSLISTQIMQLITVFFQYYILINIGLAVFNLIPLPPLDGSRILAAFMSDKTIYNYYKYQNAIMIAVFILIFTGILSIPLSFIQSFLYKFVMTITALPFSFWS